MDWAYLCAPRSSRESKPHVPPQLALRSGPHSNAIRAHYYCYYYYYYYYYCCYYYCYYYYYHSPRIGCGPA